MKSKAHFLKRAGGVFSCGNCGRRTRSTGEDNENSRTCIQCWEMAGIENAVSDGCETPSMRAEHEYLRQECLAKGGDASALEPLAPPTK